MALVFGDSFDHYLATDILKKWSSTTAATVDISEDYALSPHVRGITFGHSNANTNIRKTLTSALTTFVAGVWFRTGSIAAASFILQFTDSVTPATEHVSVRYDTAGHITFTRNATVLATSANTLAINTWYHVEVKATIGDAGDAPSGRYEVRIDGSSVGWIADSGAGQDTRNGGVASIGGVNLIARGANDATTGPTGTNHRWQDFYLLDTTGTQASDFLGPCRFAVIRPVGAGNSAQWTGNYADNWVNAADSVPDGDLTFNQDATAGHIDLFTMTDVPTGTIHAIQHVISARKDAGAARTIRPKLRIAGTNYSGTTVTLAASYLFYTEPVMFSPDTGGATAFTDTEINGMEAGYELVS